MDEFNVKIERNVWSGSMKTCRSTLAAFNKNGSIISSVAASRWSKKFFGKKKRAILQDVKSYCASRTSIRRGGGWGIRWTQQPPLGPRWWTWRWVSPAGRVHWPMTFQPNTWAPSCWLNLFPFGHTNRRNLKKGEANSKFRNSQSKN